MHCPVVGTVVMWNAEEGWGAVASPDIEGDVWIGQYAPGRPDEGMPMSRRLFPAACATFLTAATIGCSKPPLIYECRVTADSKHPVHLQVGDHYTTTRGCFEGDEQVGTRRAGRGFD